jgi:hypothetical protein
MKLFFQDGRFYKITRLGILFLGLLLVSFSNVSATSVSRNSITNLKGYPGKTIETEVILEGTDLIDKSGFWYTSYKDVEGDNERMDITSWITIEPSDYVIKKGEKKTFTVAVKIPRDAEPGLWGATSEDAGKEGHSSERRTYFIFKDAPIGGNVYSGLLLPISVNVLASPNIFASVVNFILENIIVIILSVVIIILLVRPILKKLKRKNRV